MLLPAVILFHHACDKVDDLSKLVVCNLFVLRNHAINQSFEDGDDLQDLILRVLAVHELFGQFQLSTDVKLTA